MMITGSSSFEGQKHISVFETTLSIQQNTLFVFNIVIQSSQSTVSLIRYPFDLVEFHQKIRFHYPNVKIVFPNLSNPPKNQPNHEMNSRYIKRRSFRGFLLPLIYPKSWRNKKSNADKIEKYLNSCFQNPIVRISSILKDFTSVQRDEDAFLTSQHTSITLTSTIHSSRKTPVSPPILSSIEMNQFEQILTHSLTPLPTLPVSIDDFSLLRILGKGCMGKVLLVRSKRNGKLYALKTIKKNWVLQQKELIHTRAERNILVRLRSQPYLANLHHVFQTPSQLYLVLDYYAGGDIATQMSLSSTFSEDRARFYAAEIVYGLSILHKNGIVYRDLKPENVLIDVNGHIVLTDFGLSKIFTTEDVDDESNVPCTQTFCGTAEYLAPEILLGEKYTFAVDFWSLGTLLFEMLAGITPFWAGTHMEMYKRVLEDNLEFPSNFDPITCHFLTGLLEKEACERLGWGEDGIEGIKSHPYFTTIDWTLVAEGKLKPHYIPTIKNETDLSNFDEVFTTMPVRISQSSNIDVPDGEQDPFEGFSFDPATAGSRSLLEASASTSAPLVHGTQQQQQSRFVKKRLSTALSIAAEGLSNSFSYQGPSSSSIIVFEDEPDQRVIKKRQTNFQHETFRSSTSISTLGYLMQSPEEVEEEEVSSIYSRSSMAILFEAQRNGREPDGSEFSVASAPYERPHCPLPGQVRRSIPHSNASTLANSLCSYLSDETTHVVLQQQLPTGLLP